MRRWRVNDPRLACARVPTASSTFATRLPPHPIMGTRPADSLLLTCGVRRAPDLNLLVLGVDTLDLSQPPTDRALQALPVTVSRQHIGDDERGEDLRGRSRGRSRVPKNQRNLVPILNQREL